MKIEFPLTTAPGERPQEAAGRLINCYAEPRGKGFVIHRCPGSSVFGGSSPPTFDGKYRGGAVVGSLLYPIFGGKLYTVTSAAVANEVGSIAGTDKAFIARNNNATPQLAIVAGGSVYEVINVNTLQAFTDANIGSPNSVCFHDGYFMFTYGNGDVQASGVNDITINTNHKARAESNPDGLYRGWSYQGQFFAGGPNSIEVWGAPIRSTGFPLTRIGYNITPGLIAPHAIAGFEPEFGRSPIYVASDKTVRQLVGYEPVKISPPDLDALIEQVADPSELEAHAYVSQGHAFWQLSSSTWTWTFVLTNKKWHERRSYLKMRSRQSLSVKFDNQWLVGDTDANQLLIVNHALHTEAAQPIVVTVESIDSGHSPKRRPVKSAEFYFTTGVGVATGEDPIATNPEVLISWSNDGGGTWAVPWIRNLGRQARSEIRVRVGHTGKAGPLGRRWRLQSSSPVHFGLMGGDMEMGA